MVTKKEKLKKLEEMSAEEKAAFEKKSPADQALYRARLAQQEAEEAVARANKEAEDAKASAKRSRELTAGEKKLTAAVRGGELALDAVRSAIATLVVTSTGAVAFNVKPPTEVRLELKPTPEETEEMFKRIETEANKPAASTRSTTPKITAPSFTLSHSFMMLSKGELLAPTDGSRPDATLTALYNRYGLIEPFTVIPATGADGNPITGQYRIINGKRRYWLIPENTSIPSVIVTGFPDEYTAEAAEVALDRGRSLNVLRAGEVINRARTRGKDDATIRRDMGFKTGEVDKYASAQALPPAILQGVKDGRITNKTALLISKQPAHIKEALATDFTERRAKETEAQPARITEADVEGKRQEGAAAAISRDAQTLTGLTSSVQPEDATGSAEASPANPQ